MRLKNKVAIVTGGGAGIGRAVAELFAREGACVVIAEIDPARGDETLSEIRRASGKAMFIRADVSKATDAEAMVDAAIERYGGLDVLVNNAAVQMHGQDARTHELCEHVWDRTMAINLKGVWLGSKYAIPAMIKRGGGSIVHIASPTGLVGCAPGYTAYSTSKGGVFGMTRVMAIDYGRDNIRVNAVVPGTTETPLIASLLEDQAIRTRLVANAPLGRLGTAEDVAPLVLFLASEESRYCTGGFYMVDGGLTAD